jgi:hypothetical protein
MARLQVKTPDMTLRTLELRLGTNRVGRDPDADFCLDHRPFQSTIAKSS